ncbi:hypothetical protein RYX36_026773, partial [Vicia faba]
VFIPFVMALLFHTAFFLELGLSSFSSIVLLSVKTCVFTVSSHIEVEASVVSLKSSKGKVAYGATMLIFERLVLSSDPYDVQLLEWLKDYILLASYIVTCT